MNKTDKTVGKVDENIDDAGVGDGEDDDDVGRGFRMWRCTRIAPVYHLLLIHLGVEPPSEASANSQVRTFLIPTQHHCISSDKMIG